MTGNITDHLQTSERIIILRKLTQKEMWKHSRTSVQHTHK